ncbi:MAG: Lysozyme [Moraxellaceae bacterium]|nr:Lysozyme [Moraxellaceae bacterium]
MKAGAWVWILLGVVLVTATAGGAAYFMSRRKYLEKHEGRRATVYIDTAGHPTIGVGHKLLPGEKFPRPLTSAEIDALFDRDMARIERTLMPAIRAPLNENQKTALLSWAFNVGAEAAAQSTLVKLLNAGNIRAAADELLKWNKETRDGVKVVNAGLARRREDERKLFLS